MIPISEPRRENITRYAELTLLELPIPTPTKKVKPAKRKSTEHRKIISNKLNINLIFVSDILIQYSAQQFPDKFIYIIRRFLNDDVIAISISNDCFFMSICKINLIIIYCDVVEINKDCTTIRLS
jgi:hypothetical protein